MARLREQREGLAYKVVSNVEPQPSVYFSPTDVAQSPAIVVEPANPVSANFNVSNRMGDEWRWRIWVMVKMSGERLHAYDELDELIYGESGIRRALHHDDNLPDGSTIIVTGVREYGLEGAFNSQRWVSAQVTVSVHTQG